MTEPKECRATRTRSSSRGLAVGALEGESDAATINSVEDGPLQISYQG